MARDIKASIKLGSQADTSGIQKFSKGVKGLNRDVAGMNERITTMHKSMVKAFALWQGLPALAGKLTSFTASISKMAVDIKDMAAQSGIGTEQLQVLGRLAAQNGAKMEDMNAALLRLTKSTQAAADGNKQLSERFVRLGLDLQTFKTLSPERQMERLGLAVAGATDKKQTLADLMALLGDSAAPKLMASLEMLGTQGYDQLSQKAEAAGELIKDSTVEALSRASQILDDIGHKFKVFGADILVGVTDAGSALTGMFVEMQTAILNADQALLTYGITSRKTAHAFQQLARQQLALGDFAKAQQSLDVAAEGLGPRSRLSGHRRGHKIQDQLQERLKIVKENAEKIAASQAKAAAEAQRLGADAEQAAIREAAQAAAALERDIKLKELQALQAELEKASQAATQERFAKEAAEYKKHMDNLARQAAAVRSQLASYEHSWLAPSEQVKREAQDFLAEAERLKQLGLISEHELTRARAQYNQQLERSAQLLAQEDLASAIDAQREAYAQLDPVIKELHAQFEQLGHTIEGSLGNAINDFVETGTADMKRLGQSILNDVIKAMLKAFVLKPLLGGIGGAMGKMGGVMGTLGGALAGARARS